MVYNNKFFYYIYFHTKKSLNRFLDKKVCFFLIPVCWFYQKMSKKVKNNICLKIQNIKLLLFFLYWFWSSGGVYHKYLQRLMIQSCSAHTLLTPQNTELIKPHPILHFYLWQLLVTIFYMDKIIKFQTLLRLYLSEVYSQLKPKGIQFLSPTKRFQLLDQWLTTSHLLYFTKAYLAGYESKPRSITHYT